MSSFCATFKHKFTGKTERVFCVDDYFGKHQYGFVFEDGTVLREEQMDKWERVFKCTKNEP